MLLAASEEEDRAYAAALAELHASPALGWWRRRRRQAVEPFGVRPIPLERLRRVAEEMVADGLPPIAVTRALLELVASSETDYEDGKRAVRAGLRSGLRKCAA